MMKSDDKADVAEKKLQFYIRSFEPAMVLW